MKTIIILFLLISFFASAQTVKSYVLVADTSSNYYTLEKKLNALSKSLKQEIDLQERIYDKKNNLICLPLNHDDELYAGDYYPRRYSASTLSIEYISYYDGDYEEKLMGIVVLITEDKKGAENKLVELKTKLKSAFIINAEIYMGCMH